MTYFITNVTATTPRSHIVLFFFNDTATTEIYTFSLHDALPILCVCVRMYVCGVCVYACVCEYVRSEEHTSELQSHLNLVCRLLLEKTNTWIAKYTYARTHTRAGTHAHTHTHA